MKTKKETIIILPKKDMQLGLQAKKPTVVISIEKFLNYLFKNE